MKSVAIIYGSSTGATAKVADRIKKEISEPVAVVIDVAKIPGSLKFEEYDLLILGTSTWGAGDLQDDWQDKLPLLKGANLSSKTVALFGLGDSSAFSDTFVDGMEALYKIVAGKGATVVGSVSTLGYSYSSSLAEINGVLIGLALDEENEPELTDERIKSWILSFKNNLV